MKRVLVTGVNGQLGFDVVKRLKQDGVEVQGADLADFDITDESATRNFILKYKPSVVVHCSAYTAVDKAESEPEICFAVNQNGAQNIAKACAEVGAAMVYISTDYVYGGTGESVYETNEPTAPLSVYGKSKLAGEDACRAILKNLYIVRTSWVFGKNGNNFVKTMRRLGAERESLGVVCDQVGSPTYTTDLADFLCFLIDTERYGLYHFSNEGFCSWYEFACEIFRQSGMKVAVTGIPTSAYQTAAVRPGNSRLSKQSVYDAGYPAIPSWQDALGRYLKEINE